jgi:hypothetical protein
LTFNLKQSRLPNIQDLHVYFKHSPPGEGENMDRRKNLRRTAALLVFAIAQGYTQLCFAQPVAITSASFPPPQLLARLTTKGNLPITVNGISASSGASISSDAIIETPAGVDAIVDLGPLGTLDIEPETKIKLEYDGDCIPGSAAGSQTSLQKCSVKVTVIAGCVSAEYKQGAYFQAVTQQQVVISESNKNRKDAGTFKICAGGAGAPGGAAAAGQGGLSTTAKVAIAALLIGGGSGLAWAIARNPSSSTP